MQEYSLQYIKDVWMDNIHKIDKFNLFMDNPFCVQICKYCYFNSTQSPMHSEIYKKYYYEYLPRQIEMFSDIFKKRVPDTVYFGGGTPNLMTPSIMEGIFNKIPNFDKIIGKHIENHPLFLRNEHLELYKKYDFKFISFGIQTLDKQVLAKENRLYTPIDKLRNIMYKAEELDLVVNMDLLVYLTDGSEEENMSILKKDLLILLSDLKPHIITIYPKYGVMNKDKLLKLQRTLLQTVRKYSDYMVIGLDEKSIRPDIFSYEACYFITRLSKEKFDYHKSYDCTGLPMGNPSQNVLALGGYGKRSVFNYIKVDNDLNKRFEYRTVNDNWNVKFYAWE